MNVPTIVSPIVPEEEESKRRGSRFFMKRDGKPAGNHRAKDHKDKKHKSIKPQKTSKPTRKKEGRCARLEQLLSPSLSRRMRFRLSKVIDVNNYSPVHPCELDLFSSPAVKISHYKDAYKSRWRMQQCALQRLYGDR